MPKPMKVLIEVEEIAHGRLFRLLDGLPGVVSITPVGEGPKAGKATGQKQGGAKSAPCLVLGALIAAGKPMSREQLYPVLTENGKSRASLPDTLSKLKQAGEIRASGSGRGVTYRVTPAGKKRYETACTVQPAKE